MSGREKDRKLRRKKSRRKKIHKLKQQLDNATSVTEREKIFRKLLRYRRFLSEEWLEKVR